MGSICVILKILYILFEVSGGNLPSEDQGHAEEGEVSYLSKYIQMTWQDNTNDNTMYEITTKWLN